MEDIPMEEAEKDQVSIRLSPPRKKSKVTADSSSSKGNDVNPPQPLIPNHLRHRINAHTGKCNSVLFLNNSDYLISGGKDNVINVWDPRNGAKTNTFEGFQGSVCDMAISKDNSLLVAGLTSHNLCVWDLNSGQILRTLKGHSQKVTAVDISKVNGEYMIISAALNDCVKLWSLENDYPINGFHFSLSNINAISFAAENKMVLSGHDNGKIAFYNIDRNPYYSIRQIKVHTQPVTSFCSLQNGNVLMSSGRDNLHNLIDVRTMQVCRKFKTKGNLVATNWTRTCVSPDENFAAVGSSDGMVSIWSIQMGKKIHSMKEHNGSVLSCAWSGLGNSLSTADNDGTICIWS
ncbi:hypothetical protein ACH5RR_025367 [Cinchona calisaya]|uniref:Uncharacterized protein n=1 Tax=Cinchona calisaya TaxID=153742 RepID=A0ABD2Z2T1_9GENT